MVQNRWSRSARCTGLALLIVVGAIAAACGRSDSGASGDVSVRWSDDDAAVVIALLDHEQGLVALGRQGEAMGTAPDLRQDATELATEATERVGILDRILHDAGVDVSERIRIRALEADEDTVAMICGISRGDALGLLARTPPERFDAAFRALVAQQALVEADLLEAAAGIEPASSALQALA